MARLRTGATVLAVVLLCGCSGASTVVVVDGTSSTSAPSVTGPAPASGTGRGGAPPTFSASGDAFAVCDWTVAAVGSEPSLGEATSGVDNSTGVERRRDWSCSTNLTTGPVLEVVARDWGSVQAARAAVADQRETDTDSPSPTGEPFEITEVAGVGDGGYTAAAETAAAVVVRSGTRVVMARVFTSGEPSTTTLLPVVRRLSGRLVDTLGDISPA